MSVYLVCLCVSVCVCVSLLVRLFLDQQPVPNGQAAVNYYSTEHTAQNDRGTLTKAAWQDLQVSKHDNMAGGIKGATRR